MSPRAKNLDDIAPDEPKTKIKTTVLLKKTSQKKV